MRENGNAAAAASSTVMVEVTVLMTSEFTNHCQYGKPSISLWNWRNVNDSGHSFWLLSDELLENAARTTNHTGNRANNSARTPTR